ncbi:hypothetical protein BSKO_00480 [Bryopsis sp. KO-2023]|nr:hypothetical protein BSKO_00480 [Bryopsis sp. KO-2023]
MQFALLGDRVNSNACVSSLGGRERCLAFRLTRDRPVARASALARETPGTGRDVRSASSTTDLPTTVFQDDDVGRIPGPLQRDVDIINLEEWDQFQELCSGALEMLELLLKSRGTWKRVHAAVYCRSPETYETGELQFKLANNLDLLGGDSGTEVNSKLSLGDADAQDFLVRNEFVELPHHGCSVFPLTRGMHVVGLLLLVLERDEGLSAKNIIAMGGADMGVMRSNIPSFLENDLDALRSVKKILASACDLYQSAVLLRAASSARNQFANGLLMETKGPVKMVRSMANMLHYRVPKGEPERDMVQNIQDQGARLSEVVKQLETALHLPSHMDSQKLPPPMSQISQAQDKVTCLPDSAGFDT